ncbi:MAG: hypothetical protein R3Y56_07525 [Akkermansia sp.]
MNDGLAAELKLRALACLGEFVYNAGGSDTPSASVDVHYLPVLREFLSVHRWNWAAVSAAELPSDALVVYQDAVGGMPAVYVPAEFEGIPNNRPQAQQAFCFLLAARCAPSAIGRHDVVSGMLQQYQRSLSEARYPDAWETCQKGKGAIRA